MALQPPQRRPDRRRRRRHLIHHRRCQTGPQRHHRQHLHHRNPQVQRVPIVHPSALPEPAAFPLPPMHKHGEENTELKLWEQNFPGGGARGKTSDGWGVGWTLDSKSIAPHCPTRRARTAWPSLSLALCHSRACAAGSATTKGLVARAASQDPPTLCDTPPTQPHGAPPLLNGNQPTDSSSRLRVG